MTAIIILVGGTILNFFVNAGSLWFFSKLSKFPCGSFARATTITLVIVLISIAIAVPQILLPAGARIAYLLVAFPLELILWCLVIRRGYRTTFVRSSAGMGMILLSQVLILTLNLAVIRPYFLEAYSLPSSGMAPTLRGPYHIAKCPYCGGKLVVPVQVSLRPDISETEFGICADCMRGAVVPTSDVTGPVAPSDRILVTRFLMPRRWDLVAFRHDGDVYIERLVALQGKRSQSTKMAISINGSPIGPPPDAPKLQFMWPEFLETMINTSHTMQPNELLHLGADDYFFVGDNSRRSFDSRFLGPFHKADIVGVVTAVYWPLERMRILR